MPIYPYKCEKCNYNIDRMISVKEMEHLKENPEVCPVCGSKLIRSYDHNFGFILKGDGFYKNSK